MVPFDYQQAADKWVRNPEIAPRFAQLIACLGDASAREGGSGKVIVIAHSMGGLAMREAATEVISGKPVGDRIGFAVTIGTPNTGSFLEGLITANYRGAPGLVQALYGAIGLTCSTGSLVAGLLGVCNMLASPGDEASLAMRPGSPELGRLADPPAGLALFEVAGHVTFTASLFGSPPVKVPLDVGDLLVKPDSAMHYSGRPGVTTYQDDCTNGIANALAHLGWSTCTHGGLLYDAACQQAVVDAVVGWLRNHRVPAASGSAAESFYGTWHVHGATAVFSADGTGTEKVHDGFTDDRRWIDRVLTYSLALSSDGMTLTATVTSIHWVAYDQQTQAATEIPDPNPQYPSDAVGDVWALHFEHPHLIKRVPVRPKYSHESGNPYLCGADLDPQYQNVCGA